MAESYTLESGRTICINGREVARLVRIEYRDGDAVTGWSLSPVELSELAAKVVAAMNAAPAMLAALQAIVARYAPSATPSNPDIAAMWHDARAAIVFASGTPSASPVGGE